MLTKVCQERAFLSRGGRMLYC